MSESDETSDQECDPEDDEVRTRRRRLEDGENQACGHQEEGERLGPEEVEPGLKRERSHRPTHPRGVVAERGRQRPVRGLLLV